MRLLLLTAAIAAVAGPAAAQVFAIDQRVPLKVVGDTDELVTLAQIPAGGQAPSGPFDSWVWTFMRQPQLTGVARFNASAVLTRFDCRAGTRQRLRYEFYLGEVVVNDAAAQEPPGRPAPNSIDAAAFRTVCDPAFNPDQGVRLNGARGARQEAEAFWNEVAFESSGWAMDRRAPLKPTAETGELVAFVEVPTESWPPEGGTFDAWAWSFLRDMQPGGGDASWNASAVLTRYDCRARTHQDLRLQFYQNDTLVQDFPGETPAAVPTPGSLQEFALKTVCDPAFQSGMPVLRDGPRATQRSVAGYFASMR